MALQKGEFLGFFFLKEKHATIAKRLYKFYIIAQYIYAGQVTEFLFSTEALPLCRLTCKKYSAPERWRVGDSSLHFSLWLLNSCLGTHLC